MVGVVPNGLRRLHPRSVGEADLGGRLALLGSVGWCVFTHSIRGVECAREVRAAWRALFLADSEGAGEDCRVVRLLAPSSLLTFTSPFFSADVL